MPTEDRRRPGLESGDEIVVFLEEPTCISTSRQGRGKGACSRAVFRSGSTRPIRVAVKLVEGGKPARETLEALEGLALEIRDFGEGCLLEPRRCASR